MVCGTTLPVARAGMRIHVAGAAWAMEASGSAIAAMPWMKLRRLSMGSVAVVEGEDRLALVPGAAREVGEVQRLEALGDRLFGQRRDGAPGHGVVDIDRHRRIGFQRFDEGMDHEEVHAAVAGAGRAFAVAPPQRVL